MPKYTNITNSNIALGQHNIGPKESITIQEYFPATSGITIDNTVGFYNPIISSTKLTSTGTVTVPVIDGAYEIEVYCSAGEATVKFNDAAAVAQYLVPSKIIKEKCFNRIIDSIIVTIASSATIYVTIRKV